jgi:hypothetical protein
MGRDLIWSSSTLASCDRAPGDSEFTTFTKEEQVLVLGPCASQGALKLEYYWLLAALGQLKITRRQPRLEWEDRMVLIKEDQ